MQTKTCNLTEDEINYLIESHGNQLSEDSKQERIERINYLNKRLKAFSEPETKLETISRTVTDAQPLSEQSASGWPTSPAI